MRREQGHKRQQRQHGDFCDIRPRCCLFCLFVPVVSKKIHPQCTTRFLVRKAQSNRLQWVTIGYYEQSDIINKNIVTHRNSSELIGTHNTHLPKHHDPNFLSEGHAQQILAPYRISCQKGSDLALTRKLADGTYYAYFPFASLTEESKMTPYHKKLLVKSSPQHILKLRNIQIRNRRDKYGLDTLR